MGTTAARLSPAAPHATADAHVQADVEDVPPRRDPALGLEWGRDNIARACAGVDARRPASAPLGPATVLALQRTAGNAAVTRWLAGARKDTTKGPSNSQPGKRQLSRYEAGEHAQLAGGLPGDQELLPVNGVHISKANIIAMGDFFRTPEDMHKADPAVLKKLDETITLDRRARLHETGADGRPLTPPSNDEIQQITKPLGEGNTYMDLNKENDAHFAPPTDGASADGKDHKSTFEKLHRQALDEAHEVALQTPAPTESGDEPAADERARGAHDPAGASPPTPERAVTTNMFAAHFLTDAFAAGHLNNKKEVMEQAKAAWKKTGATLLQKNRFTNEVSALVLKHPDVEPKMANMQIMNVRAVPIGVGAGAVLGGIAGAALGGGAVGAALGGVGGAALGGVITYGLYEDVTEGKLSDVLHVTSLLKPDTFFNIFARMVHDRLNKEGVEVTNGEDTWMLSGDATLNDDSLRVASKAVVESEKNIEEAARTPGDLPYDEMIRRVWTLVPHPTDTGQKLIDTVREELTNAANDEAIKAAVELTAVEIDVAIGEMIKMHILRPKPGTTAGGAGDASGPSAPTSASPIPDGRDY